MPRHVHYSLNNVHGFLLESFCSEQCSSIEQTGVVYKWLKLVSEHAWLLIMSYFSTLRWNDVQRRDSDFNV